jgi:hypothetical protein
LCDEHLRIALRAGVYLDHFRRNVRGGLRDRWNAPDLIVLGRFVADATWVPGLATLLIAARAQGWLGERALRATVAGARRLPSALRWDPRWHRLPDNWPGDPSGDDLIALLVAHERGAGSADPATRWAEATEARHEARTREGLFALHERLLRLFEHAMVDRSLADRVFGGLRATPERRWHGHDDDRVD